ncbi:MAG: acyl carrier protein [Thermanaeromonas sp.]|uniref:acyl carrier protein n=1 Tax=Thermanaeromonas sp. TaxID=2003697 RepID=UPI00243BA26F|nr:acyl carrier protein [Thermanaeromonas sp.]MCG0278115.1 acyl carrier protein [Thermanaeromonas sp.]
MDDIFNKVKSIVAEQLGVDEEEISLDTSFEDLNADSLDIVELIMALEEEFDIEIPDEDAEKLTTVGAAVEYIRQRAKSVG